MNQIKAIKDKLLLLDEDYRACITVRSLLAHKKDWTGYYAVGDLMDTIDAEIDNLNSMIVSRD